MHFVEIVPTETQIAALYELLKQRVHKISHAGLPAWEDHAAFVRTNPYRAWYLALEGEKPCGSVYLTENNEIGINLMQPLLPESVEEALQFIQRAHAPFPPIPSVRGAGFFVHVAQSNEALMSALLTLGHPPIQTTFRIVSPKA